MFYKYSNRKRRVKENPPPLLDAVENIITEDEEKLRFSMPSFTMSVIVRLVILSWKTGVGNRIKHPRFRFTHKRVSDHSTPCGCHKSTELGGIHPRVLMELVEVPTMQLSIICWQSVLVKWKGLR